MKEIDGIYYIQNIESGEWETISKEGYEFIKAQQQKFAEFARKNNLGQKIICGTGGEINKTNFSELWDKSFLNK